MTNGHHGDVLVGLGDPDTGSPALDWAALDWAAGEAALRHRNLHVVRAYQWVPGVAHWAAEGDEILRDDLASAVHRQLAQAVAHVETAWPDVRVTGTVVEDSAARALVQLSAAADVTVLGSRHLSTIGAAVLGSVSTVVAAGASGAVVVVNGPAGEPAEYPAVVVGVDGSPIDHDVLGFAFDHASRHTKPLHAVHCWRPDMLAAMQWRPEQPAPDEPRRGLAEALGGWQEKYPDVAVDASVVRDHPVAGLVAASLSQHLLVVGGRAHHARAAALLGSVSQGVLHHAWCPVAVVHAGGSAGTPGDG